jgi:hypothetical protein
VHGVVVGRNVLERAYNVIKDAAAPILLWDALHETFQVNYVRHEAPVDKLDDFRARHSRRGNSKNDMYIIDRDYSSSHALNMNEWTREIDGVLDSLSLKSGALYGDTDIQVDVPSAGEYSVETIQQQLPPGTRWTLSSSPRSGAGALTWTFTYDEKMLRRPKIRWAAVAAAVVGAIVARVVAVNYTYSNDAPVRPD